MALLEVLEGRGSLDMVSATLGDRQALWILNRMEDGRVHGISAL